MQISSSKLVLVLAALALPVTSGAELAQAKNIEQENESRHVAAAANSNTDQQSASKQLQQELPILAAPCGSNSSGGTNRSHCQPLRRQHQPTTPEYGRQEDELNIMAKQVIVSLHSPLFTSDQVGSGQQQQQQQQGSQVVADPASARVASSRSNSHQIEPLKHIDPAATNSASKYPTLGSLRQFNGTRLARFDHQPQQQSMRHQTVPEFNVGASDPNSNDGSMAQGTLRARELHFGAKVALSILMAVILLVASATFVDLNSSATNENLVQQLGANQQQPRVINSHYQVEKRQQAQPDPRQRDQRSPSLSSSSSSTLFSSANSLSSASAPILSKNNEHTKLHSNICGQSSDCCQCKHQAHSASWLCRVKCHLAECYRRKQALQRQQYCQNLQTAATTGSQRQEESLLAAVLKVTGCEIRGSRVSSGLSASNSCCAQQQQQTSVIVSKTSDEFERKKQLARQVFLSFSLRHSASLIFEASDGNSRGSAFSGYERKLAHPQTSPLLERRNSLSRAQHNAACGHRSRLSSLSSVNETSTMSTHHIHNECYTDDSGSSDVVCELNTCCCTCQQDLIPSNLTTATSHIYDNNSANLSQKHEAVKASSSARIESIDSLHGLRFLSMIWIIVIHSYSFALRWLFFTNSPTLDNIYKTAASQLLANGTFACDSFFFAGGFLLPYLAFPAYKPPNEQPVNHRNNHYNQQNGGSRTQATATTTSFASTQYHRRSSTAIVAGTASAASNNIKLDEQRQQCIQDGNSSSLEARSACPSPIELQNQQQEDSLSSSGSFDSRQSRASFHQLSGPQTTQSNKYQIINNHKLSTTTSATWHNNHNHQQQHFSDQPHLNTNEFTLKQVVGNIFHRYIRMMPLMMAIIGLSASLLRYMGEGPTWDDSTIMFDKWCRKNWWINTLFLHNFINRENMCLSHSWYSAVDIQLFLIGQLIMFILYRSRRVGLLVCCTFLFCTQLINGALTLIHNLPAVPLIASVSEQSMNLYYGEIYIKPYCRASPYLIGIILAYLMRTTSLGQIRLQKWQVATGWIASISTLVAILMAMQPAMNGQTPSELQSALYSSLSRPLWACATGWMIFACMTKHGGIFATILGARCFIPLSRLTYPAFLIHPIVMAVFYGSRQSSFQFSHYLMLYLILGNIVITYAIAFLLSALFELPLLSVERAIKRAWYQEAARNRTCNSNSTKRKPQMCQQ